VAAVRNRNALWSAGQPPDEVVERLPKLSAGPARTPRSRGHDGPAALAGGLDREL